jgi:phage-related protein
MTTLLFFREDDGRTPFVDWFRALPEKAQDRCRARIERLRALGHLLRRPEADYLRNGIYELRAKAEGINYRMLFFFHGQQVVVVSHGLTKQRAAVPPKDIDLAVRRKREFTTEPARHTQTLKEPL